MKNILLIIAVIFIFENGWACGCLENNRLAPASEFFEENTIIFEGIVLSSRVDDKGNGWTKFKILTKFKPFEAEEVIEIDNDVPSSCALELSNNSQVLIAATKGSDGHYSIYQCIYSRLKIASSIKQLELYQQDKDFLDMLSHLADGPVKIYLYDFEEKKSKLVLEGNAKNGQLIGDVTIYNKLGAIEKIFNNN